MTVPRRVPWSIGETIVVLCEVLVAIFVVVVMAGALMSLIVGENVFVPPASPAPCPTAVPHV